MLLSVIDLVAFLCLAVAVRHRRLLPLPGLLVIELPPADAAPPALPDELPRVLVQIPVYNEPLVVERALVAAAALDWPRDRLTIQLLDDSTDITSDIAVHAVARLRARRRRRRPRPARRPQRLQGRRPGGGPGALRRALRRGVRCRLRAARPTGCGGAMAALLAEPARRFRADPHRMGQWRAELADARAAADAGRPFRRRAGRPRPPRRAFPVQRHRRHLAPRRGRGGGRLVARHPVGGSRPGAAHAPRGLARRVPDGAARGRRAAAASSTISAPSRAAGRRASCRSRASCSARSGVDWSGEAKFTTTVALGQQLIFPVLAVGVVALVAVGRSAMAICRLLPLPAVAVAARHAGGAVRHDLGRLSPAEARRPRRATSSRRRACRR